MLQFIFNENNEIFINKTKSDERLFDELHIHVVKVLKLFLKHILYTLLFYQIEP